MTSTDPQPPADPPDTAAYRRAEPSVLAARVWTGPLPGTGRREGKGHITSYGAGRTCSVAGCRTILSIYNQRASCAGHLPLGEAGTQGR